MKKTEVFQYGKMNLSDLRNFLTCVFLPEVIWIQNGFTEFHKQFHYQLKKWLHLASMGHHLDGDTNVCAGVLRIDSSNQSGLKLIWIIFPVNLGRLAEHNGNYHCDILKKTNSSFWAVWNKLNILSLSETN